MTAASEIINDFILDSETRRELWYDAVRSHAGDSPRMETGRPSLVSLCYILLMKSQSVAEGKKNFFP